MKRRIFLANWITPSVVAVLLPAHARASPGDEGPPPDFYYNFTLTGGACSDGSSPATASFTICNHEGVDAYINHLDLFLPSVHTPQTTEISVSPALPVIIPAFGGCVDFTIKSIVTPPFSCETDTVSIVGRTAPNLDGPRGHFGFELRVL